VIFHGTIIAFEELTDDQTASCAAIPPFTDGRPLSPGDEMLAPSAWLPGDDVDDATGIA
jgi:hypothetical protein